MRNYLFTTALSALLLMGCTSDSESSKPSVPVLNASDEAGLNTNFQYGEHIACTDGKIHISKIVKKLFYDDFHQQNSSKWGPVENYEGRIDFTYGECEGGSRGLVLTKNPKITGTDTAFNMESKPFKVFAGTDFVLTISARGSVNMGRCNAEMDAKYASRLVWLNAKGEKIGSVPCQHKTLPDSVISTKIVGKVPEDAVQAVVHLGADGPNVEAGKYLCYTGVSFEAEDGDSRIWPMARFVSRPFLCPFAKNLAWEADTPGKTAVMLQISTAPDEDGAPGQWSPFVGPDLDPQKAFYRKQEKLPDFPSDHAWLRYRVLLSGQAGVSPVLESVTIGEITDRNWSGADVEPPVVARLSPKSMTDAGAPVSFQLRDNTQVDWRTLEMKLDGKDISTKLKRDHNVVTFTPEAPLEPACKSFANLADWKVLRNHENHLSFEPIQGTPNSIRITRKDAQKDTCFKLQSPTLLVKPGTVYDFSINIRHTLAFEKTPKNAPMGLSWMNARGVAVGQYVPIFFENSKDVQKIQVKLTAPADAAKACFFIGFDSPNIFDGNCLELWDAAMPGADFDRGPNYHTFTVRAADISGNRMDTNFYMLYDKRPPIRNQVSIREDGAVLLDGKPFFPIGLYAVWKREFNNNSFDKAFLDMRKAGFNLAHTYNSFRGPAFSEFMDAADANGVKLFIASGAGANHQNIDAILQDVVRECRHPALLSWYLADDTSEHISPEVLHAIHRAIHQVDNAHITCQADGVHSKGPVSHYADFVHSTDCFMPEIYPVSDTNPEEEMVPSVIRDMKTIRKNIEDAGSPVKSIWPILQYFQGWSNWKRYPTEDELRATSYLAIIHGGNGITWYTYGGYGKNHGVCDTPERWAAISKVATELSRLQNVFLTQGCCDAHTIAITQGPHKDALGYDSISVLHKVVGERHFLICANSAKQEVQVTFDVPDMEFCKVWFEERGVSKQDGVFADTFKPNGVHVYELTKFME